MIKYEDIKYSPYIYNGSAYSNLKLINGKWVFEEQDLLDFTEEYLSNTSSVMFDIGASIGDFSMLPLTNKSLTIYSFEPNPVLYKLLRYHIRNNFLDNNVNTYPYALCDRDEIIKFYISENVNRCGQSCIDNIPKFSDGYDSKEILVKGMKLDTFVDTKQINKVDFIKIDVEGAEIKVLDGAKETIINHHPDILIEVVEKNLMAFGKSVDDLYNLLSKLGYVRKLKIGDKDELWVKQ